MISNYLKIIFRSFLRNKLYSFTNFLGLAVAMLGFIIVSLYVNYELSYDQFHDDIDDIYMLRMRYTERNRDFFNQFLPPVFGQAIEAQIPGVDAVTVTGTGVGSIDVLDKEGNFLTEPFYTFQPSFFDVFTFDSKHGDARKALADARSIVISRELAMKYFGVENAIGQTLKLKELGQFKVGAVLMDFPNNSQFQPHLILPLKATTDEESLINWNSNTNFIYLRLNEETNKENLKTNLISLYSDNNPKGWYSNGTADLFPFGESYWNWSMSGAALNNRTQGLGADKRVIVICSSLAIILLLIALANYVNMATSRAIQRSKEVSVRKVNGASPMQLIFQFLTESIAFAFVSLLVALIGVELILPSVSRVMGIQLELDFSSFHLLGLLFGYALTCGLVAGIYPAIFMSRFRPARVLKSKLVQGGKRISLFKILLGIQFTLSALLITVILILNAQVRHYTTFDLGFDKDQVISISLPGPLRGNAHRLMNDLRALPGVAGVTFGPLPSSADGFSDVVFGGKELKSVTRLQTDENFVPVMDIKMQAGRNFNPNISTDFSESVLINQKLVDALGLNEPVNSQITISGFNKRVIGVVDNFYSDGSMSNIRNLIIWPRRDQAHHLLVRLNNLEALKRVEGVYLRHDEEGLMKYTWLDEAYNKKFHRVSRVVSIINGSTLLTVFVSLFGLLAMLAFSISNRLKEIGVRKVLGARFFQLQWSIAKPFLLVNLISLLIAVPLGYYLVGEMIKNYPNKIELGLSFGFMAFAVTCILNFIIVGIRGVSVSNINPIDILKDE
ncbi:ABC transporter permease [Roseivirga sp.]|uniref:ABC transporter permease n=1 Tax=Roseivirga sp. TaxID=1964215 RepID=UPI003B5296B7